MRFLYTEIQSFKFQTVGAPDRMVVKIRGRTTRALHPMNTDVIATELLAALDGNTTIGAITNRDPSFDADAAYQVSAEILRRRRARGETPIGRKVGFTNRTIWAEYGVFTPMWACVYDSTVAVTLPSR